MIKAWVDGGCEGNNSKTGPRFSYGSYVVEQEGKMPTVQTFELPGASTNNQAEYLALIKLLEDENLQDATVYMDSQIVVGHLTQHWKVCRSLRQFKQRAAAIVRKHNITISKVDRKVMVSLLGH
ncbi:hypothetical protein LCGC14_2383050 [marine sediment metagenome]|uniref:RNase H type-1 domain-containing protein n=1 Tax=marine sediment metagenome TaxID=412755 RepID=A0A0F9C0D7_9ZZZZ